MAEYEVLITKTVTYQPARIEAETLEEALLAAQDLALEDDLERERAEFVVGYAAEVAA